jgi:uncharacterized protein YukE
MAVWGLDVEQVQTLSKQLNQESQSIQQILKTLTGALNNTQWTGPDATAFRNDWTGSHTAALNNVANALQQASAAAAKNASDQASVSNS